MIHKYISLFLAILIFCSSCGLNISNESAFTATPGFVTATLQPTRISAPTNTPFPVTPAPVTSATVIAEGTTPPSVEGTTTTQLNVRAEPSTASESLGIINQFSPVQVIGKDASGSWYQVIYAGSATGRGWVRAEYVQVNATAEIAVIGGVAGSGSGVSGIVIQKINVRSGPGTTYESLGVLNPKDVVFITGKDSSGAWMQIEFMSAADGKGWVTEKYLQIENLDSIPVIGAVKQTIGTPDSIASTPTIAVFSAIQDGDSMQAPLASVIFSATGTHDLQVNSDISTPNGDAEDWVQFTPFSKSVLIEAKCSNSSFHVELWSNGQFSNEIMLACGGKLTMPTVPYQSYYFRIKAINSNDPQYIQYTFKISSIE
ncbi:MAG: SH3 domain-containing protein [Chloroflexi bacterium]|nr:SH3 domain-containing protein [Chloroflexota bacterium]